MTIELWPIDRVIPYARNARKLTAVAVDKAGQLRAQLDKAQREQVAA